MARLPPLVPMASVAVQQYFAGRDLGAAMSKTHSDTDVALDLCGAFLLSVPAYRRVALALAVCLAIAGCSMHDDSDDQSRQGGFYGGVSGGMTR